MGLLRYRRVNLSQNIAQVVFTTRHVVPSSLHTSVRLCRGSAFSDFESTGFWKEDQMFLAFLGATNAETFHTICYCRHDPNPCVRDQTCLNGFRSGRGVDYRSDNGLQSRINAFFYENLVCCLMEEMGAELLGTSFGS